MTVSERIIQDYLSKGLTMADVPRELKYRLNDRGEMKIYRYLVERGDIQENPPEPVQKPEPKKPEPQPKPRPVEQPKGDNNTMNTYLAQMRDALSSYYTSAQRLMEQKQKNSETYQAEVAEEQNQGIDAKLSQLYADTWKALQDAQAAGIAQAEKWGELDGRCNGPAGGQFLQSFHWVSCPRPPSLKNGLQDIENKFQLARTTPLQPAVDFRPDLTGRHFRTPSPTISRAIPRISSACLLYDTSIRRHSSALISSKVTPSPPSRAAARRPLHPEGP